MRGVADSRISCLLVILLFVCFQPWSNKRKCFYHLHGIILSNGFLGLLSYCRVVFSGKKMWQSTHPRKFGNHVTVRPTVRPHHRQTNAKFRVGCERIVFGAKTKGRPRFVKHKQLKTSARSTQKKKKFFVSVEHPAIPQFLISY